MASRLFSSLASGAKSPPPPPQQSTAVLVRMRRRSEPVVVELLSSPQPELLVDLEVPPQERLLLEKEEQEDKQEKKGCYNEDDDQSCGVDLNKNLITPSNHTVPGKEEWRKKLMGSFYGYLSWPNVLKSEVQSTTQSNTPESDISHSSGSDDSRASSKRRLKSDEVAGNAVAERINSKKRKRGSGVPNNGPEPPPGLPVEFRNFILQRAGNRAVCVEKLVIQKELTKTDVNGTQNRLSIPARLVREEFLTEEEHLLLCQRNGKNVCSIDEVPLITPMMEVAKVSLRRWEMKKERGVSSVSYVIANTWNEIRRRNKFERKMIVQLWAIRVDVDLWMALVRLS